MTAGHSKAESLFPTVNPLDRQGIRTEVCVQRGQFKSRPTYCTHDTQWAVGHPTLSQDSFLNLSISSKFSTSYHVHITFHEPGTIWTYFTHSKILPFLFCSDTYVQIHY
jgi:hypothetical protein